MNSDEAKQSPPGPSLARGLHGRVLEQIGLAICGREMPSGSVMRIEEIEKKYDVSRSVIRETLRVLESMGLVISRRRVGVLIQPPSEWNLYDPQVIRWRLASRARATQLRSLTELRIAIEPEAARLAALRASLINASDLVGLSGRLWAAGEAGDVDLFLTLDIEFHSMVLISSGNEMFAKLDSLVGEVLAGRTNSGLMPAHPHEEALQWHVDVAGAIQRGDSVSAQGAMLSIMQRTMQEMSSIWEEPFKNTDYIRAIGR